MNVRRKENVHSDSTVHLQLFPAASVLVIFKLSGVIRSEYAIDNDDVQGTRWPSWTYSVQQNDYDSVWVFQEKKECLRVSDPGNPLMCCVIIYLYLQAISALDEAGFAVAPYYAIYLCVTVWF